MHSRQVRGKEFRSRQHRLVRGRRKDEIDHIPRVAHAQNLGGRPAPGRPVGRLGPALHFGFWIADFGFGTWQAGWTIWARWRQGNSTGPTDRRVAPNSLHCICPETPGLIMMIVDALPDPPSCSIKAATS